MCARAWSTEWQAVSTAATSRPQAAYFAAEDGERIVKCGTPDPGGQFMLTGGDALCYYVRVAVYLIS